MSQENVRIVLEAFGYFDVADWDSYGEYWTEDAQVWPPHGWPEPGPFAGRGAIVEEWRRVREEWSVSHVTVEDHTERGDRLVARLNWVAEGAGSHLPVNMEVSAAYRFQGRRIAELRFFWNQGDALEAAGLQE